MGRPSNYDFCGWATKYGVQCSDGNTIAHGAFDDQNGRTVPLVMSHKSTSADAILGKVYLEKRPEGLYAYGMFNNTPSGQSMKEAVQHGDIEALSVCANKLTRNDLDAITHGIVREISLVAVGANPGAFIESVIYHGMPLEYDETDGIIYSTTDLKVNEKADPDPKISHADDKRVEPNKDKDEDEDDPKTVAEILDTLTDKQKAAVGILLEDMEQNSEKEENKESDDMKHNMFMGDSYDGMDQGGDTITHEDRKEIFKMAQSCKSFKDAYDMALTSLAEEHNLKKKQVEDMIMHSLDTTGMETPVGTNTYGVRDLSMLFPDAKSVTTQPDFISRDMGWVNEVMSNVHRTPFSKIRTVHADITEDEARAKGYITGKQKKTEVFTLLKRSTSPTTLYKHQKVDRDDIIDVVDFDVVLWIKGEMELMLREEYARAILIGDGRSADSDDKIKEDCIRPIAKDAPLYSIKQIVKIDKSNPEYVKAVINDVIKSRKKYKGSGSPTFFTTDDLLTDMLLLEDKVGHRLYKTEEELATALRVRKVVGVPVMENEEINYNNKDYELGGIIVNLVDYNVGTDRGGEKNMFEGFDIDYNQFKYLMETRGSGALIKPFSAITLLLDTSGSSSGSETGTPGGSSSGSETETPGVSAQSYKSNK